MDLKNFQLANELLHKVVGGQQNAEEPRYFAFNGVNAAQEARMVSLQTQQACGCGCGCSGGAGNGGGSGR